MYRKLLRDHSTTSRAPHQRIGVATHPLKLAHTLHTAQQVCTRLEHLPQSTDKRETHRKAANYPKLTTCLWASSHTTHIASRAASTTLFIESSCFSSSTFRCSSCLLSPPDNCLASTCLAVTCQSRSTETDRSCTELSTRLPSRLYSRVSERPVRPHCETPPSILCPRCHQP